MHHTKYAQMKMKINRLPTTMAARAGGDGRVVSCPRYQWIRGARISHH
jgi:hypothetical protein